MPCHFEGTNNPPNLFLLQCRLIVSTMSNQRCQPFNVMLYPLCVILFIVPFIRSVKLEVALLVLYTAGVAIFHIHYGIFLVSIRSRLDPLIFAIGNKWECFWSHGLTLLDDKPSECENNHGNAPSLTALRCFDQSFVTR